MTFRVHKRYHAVELVARYIGIVNKVISQKGVHLGFQSFHCYATFGEKPHVDYNVTLFSPSATRSTFVPLTQHPR